LQHRSQGISPHTIAFYQTCLKPLVERYDLMPEGVNESLVDLSCNAGGKLAYRRAVRAFCNWLVRNDYPKDDRIRKVAP